MHPWVCKDHISSKKMSILTDLSSTGGGGGYIGHSQKAMKWSWGESQDDGYPSHVTSYRVMVHIKMLQFVLSCHCTYRGKIVLDHLWWQSILVVIF